MHACQGCIQDSELGGGGGGGQIGLPKILGGGGQCNMGGTILVYRDWGVL